MNKRIFEHDGHEFQYTLESITNAKPNSVIGFYFDDLGFPQQIKKNSLYGEHIMNNYWKI